MCVEVAEAVPSARAILVCSGTLVKISAHSTLTALGLRGDTSSLFHESLRMQDLIAVISVDIPCLVVLENVASMLQVWAPRMLYTVSAALAKQNWT